MESGSLVNADLCAVALSVPKTTIYKMVKRGTLIAYRVGEKGRGLRFDIAECRAALRRQATQTQEEVR